MSFLSRLLLPFVAIACFWIGFGASQPALAYSSNICAGATCTRAEVGVFMQDISQDCGNKGICTLNGDIMTVVQNVGNFILEIIGSLLLAFYVYGGFCLLLSGGESKWVQKGKGAIKTSTIGLLIILCAWLGINSLKSLLLGNYTPGTAPAPEFVTCNGTTEATNGQACALGKVCQGAACVEACVVQFPGNSCKSVDISNPPAGCVNTSGLCGDTGGVCCP